METKIKDYWQNLNAKKKELQFSKTKFLNDKLEVKIKILSLLNDKLENVSQLSDFGIIVLNQTILHSHDKTSIAEQGIISNDFFKARIIDVDNTLVKGVYFHLVKVISGIISIDLDHELILTTDEEFRTKRLNNKITAKLFGLFLQDFLQVEENLNKKIKININENNLNLKFNKDLAITKEIIFKIRNVINEFLAEKRINYQKYPFLKDVFTKLEKENLTRLELIEIQEFIKERNNFSVTFLVGKEKVNDFFLENKKELLASVRVINKKIKLINNVNLVELHPEVIIDSYEKLEKLNQQVLQLKKDFTNFQNQYPEIIKNFIDESIERHYSEKIGDYELIHINFNNLLIDKDLLESRALEKIGSLSDKVLFLSNNNFDNSMVILKISQNLTNKFNLTTLINQFSNSDFKKISYNQDTIFIEANNFQVINDFISNIINFFKISNNQLI